MAKNTSKFTDEERFAAEHPDYDWMDKDLTDIYPPGTIEDFGNGKKVDLGEKAKKGAPEKK